MVKLNRNEPYGEVTGSAGNVRYSQNHKDFDGNGNELDADGNLIEDDSEHPEIVPVGTSPDFPVLQPLGKPSFEGELPDEEATVTSGKPTARAIHERIPDPHINEGDVPVILDSEDPGIDAAQGWAERPSSETDAEHPRFHKLPVVQLKEIMDSHGEPYVNKAQAVEFLNNKHAESNAAEPVAEERHEETPL